MGVRNGDAEWKRRLNEIIAKRQGDIDKILLDYGLPLLVDDDTKMDIVTSPRPNGGVAPPEKAEAPRAPRVDVPVPASAAGAQREGVWRQFVLKAWAASYKWAPSFL